MLYPLIERHIINDKNLVVFDETVIGDGVHIQGVVGELRDSDGGNINALLTCVQSLGTFILLQFPDGTTPFRFFVFRRD